MADTLIEFPKLPPKLGQLDRETGIALSGTQPEMIYSRPVGSRSATSAALAPIPIDALYPPTEGTPSDIATALLLLGGAISLLENARSAGQQGDWILADRCTQRLQAALPDLFKPRKIGDGYGLVINAIHIAFLNKRGKPLNMDQLTTIWRVLKELRRAPFTQFEAALDCVEELEGCGLEVDPRNITDLVPDADDE